MEKEFVDIVITLIPRYLPEKFGDAEIFITEIMKNNNQPATALCIKKKESPCFPNIYLEPFYAEYRSQNKTLDDICSEIAKIRVEHDRDISFDEINFIPDWNKVKNLVKPVLISKTLNGEYLSDKVYTDYLDLAIIYKIAIDDFIGFRTQGVTSVTITKPLLRGYGITEEELHEQAVKNLSGEAVDFRSVKSIMIAKGIPEALVPDTNMWVLTNTKLINGASVVLNPEAIAKVQETLGDTFYIIPSSIHECLVMPEEGVDEHALRGLIGFVNETEVSKTDWLSDHPYFYNGEEIVIAG